MLGRRRLASLGPSAHNLLFGASHPQTTTRTVEAGTSAWTSAAAAAQQLPWPLLPTRQTITLDGIKQPTIFINNSKSKQATLDFES